MSLSSSRTALVVGANRGIGLSLCKRFKTEGRAVIAACRRSSPALEALGARVEPGVDVTDDAGVAALAKRLEGVVLDELVCNAGILRQDDLDGVDLDEVRAQLEVNALGPLRVVKALVRSLDKERGFPTDSEVLTTNVREILDDPRIAAWVGIAPPLRFRRAIVQSTCGPEVSPAFPRVETAAPVPRYRSPLLRRHSL